MARITFEYHLDKWVFKNIVPFYTQSKFAFMQKVSYNRTYTRAFTLCKCVPT